MVVVVWKEGLDACQICQFVTIVDEHPIVPRHFVAVFIYLCWPSCHHLPDPPVQLSLWPAKAHPQIHQLWKPSDTFFFHGHLFKLCGTFWRKICWNWQKKSQTKSTALGRFLVVNGCSKGRGRFSCSFHNLSAHKARRANLKWHVWHLILSRSHLPFFLKNFALSCVLYATLDGRSRYALMK